MLASSHRKRPPFVLVFGGYFLVMPLLYLPIVGKNMLLGRGHVVVPLAFILVGSLVVGVSLIAARRWSLWVFYLYSLLLGIYDINVLLANPNVFNFGVMLQLGILIMAGGYFMRPDVWAPYLAPQKRPWRRFARKPAEVTVRIDEHHFTTRDISSTGLYAVPGSETLTLGTKVTIEFTAPPAETRVEGTIVRLDPEGFGVAFLSRQNRFSHYKVIHGISS